jgi:hypothetical protein
MDENIQPEGVSQVGATSNEVITEPTTGTTSEVAQTQPLTQEQVSKMVSDEIAKATETAKREIQSIKDKARAEVESQARKAQLAEATLNQVRGKLKDADPAFAEQLEVEELRTRDRHYRSMEQEQVAYQQQAQFDQQFKQNLSQFVTGMGVDPNDKRVDWGDDASNYLDKQNRILASVAKIQQEESQKALEMTSKEFKALEKKLRKDLGLDSVDTSNPAGGSGINKDAATRLKERYPTMK